MYSTEVNGEVFQFGTSGWLYQSNKLMYDKGTNTLWHQFRGEPAVGQLVGSGITLELLPIVLTTWSDWLATHPDTTVLDVRTGVYPPRAYLSEFYDESTYASYRQSVGTMFPVPERSELLETKSRVFGLIFNGQARAYPQALLKETPIINDSLGGGDLVVVTPGGKGARAYQRAGQNFVSLKAVNGEAGAIFLIDDDNRRWRLEEDALVRADDPSVRLPRLPSRSSYWFGWYAFYPGTDVYDPG